MQPRLVDRFCEQCGRSTKHSKTVATTAPPRSKWVWKLNAAMCVLTCGLWLPIGLAFWLHDQSNRGWSNIFDGTLWYWLPRLYRCEACGAVTKSK